MSWMIISACKDGMLPHTVHIHWKFLDCWYSRLVLDRLDNELFSFCIQTLIKLIRKFPVPLGVKS